MPIEEVKNSHRKENVRWKMNVFDNDDDDGDDERKYLHYDYSIREYAIRRHTQQSTYMRERQQVLDSK